LPKITTKSRSKPSKTWAVWRNRPKIGALWFHGHCAVSWHLSSVQPANRHWLEPHHHPTALHLSTHRRSERPLATLARLWSHQCCSRCHRRRVRRFPGVWATFEEVQPGNLGFSSCCCWKLVQFHTAWSTGHQNRVESEKMTENVLMKIFAKIWSEDWMKWKFKLNFSKWKVF